MLRVARPHSDGRKRGSQSVLFADITRISFDMKFNCYLHKWHSDIADLRMNYIFSVFASLVDLSSSLEGMGRHLMRREVRPNLERLSSGPTVPPEFLPSQLISHVLPIQSDFQLLGVSCRPPPDGGSGPLPQPARSPSY